MSEVSQQAAEFLENVFEMTGLELRVGVKQGIAGQVLARGRFPGGRGSTRRGAASRTSSRTGRPSG